MLVGACVTHFWGVQGEVHIRADKAETLTVRQSIIPSIHHSVSLFLWDFQIVYAGDGETPVDYVSQLRLLDRSRHTDIHQRPELSSRTGLILLCLHSVKPRLFTDQVFYQILSSFFLIHTVTFFIKGLSY